MSDIDLQIRQLVNEAIWVEHMDDPIDVVEYVKEHGENTLGAFVDYRYISRLMEEETS